jgi:serine/threonine protein kinase
MTEREIFLDALEREDSAARAAFLDVACAGRPALRRRVEELLRYHRENPRFLNVPAMEQLAAAEKSLAFLGKPAEPGSLGRLDHYEVLELVGRGSTGIVLKARDTKLQRVVAIKALTPQLAASSAARQRFVREAQAAAAVRDDNVVAIYAVSDDGPVPYLVMEYIGGQTLEQRVGRGKALELKVLLRIGMQMATGLAAAHAQGLVHRDIKLANILLENSIQRVKITDFGLARVAADADPTAAGALAGTPLYMSPEQARGEPTDQRTDLFSLGSVLYTLCAGRPPFRADTTAEVLKRVCAETPPPVREINPGVPEWLGNLIGKLHAKDVSARPASAREVADLLGRQLALLQQPPLSPSPSPAPPASVKAAAGFWRGPLSRRFLVALCLVGLLAAVATLIVLLIWWQHQEAERREKGDGRGERSGPVEPLDLRREDIPPPLLTLAGGGDAALAPPELAAVLGDGKFLLPRIASAEWMCQSPDGQLLAVPSVEDVVLFDVSTGAYRQTLQGPGGYVLRVTFSRDSRLLAATTWYSRAGSDPLPGHTGVVRCVAYSPDGTWLASGGEDKTVRLHDLRGGGARTLKGSQAGSMTWPSPRTAVPWPLSATTRIMWSGSGTRKPGRRRPCRGTPGASPAWRSRRRRPCWPPAAMMARFACGTEPAATRRRARSGRVPSAARSGRWRSRRTAATWPRPTPTGRCTSCAWERETKAEADNPKRMQP